MLLTFIGIVLAIFGFFQPDTIRWNVFMVALGFCAWDSVRGILSMQTRNQVAIYNNTQKIINLLLGKEIE